MNMTDTNNRDEKLKAYLCAILDVPEGQFNNVVKDIRINQDEQIFIDMVCNDLKSRIERILKEGRIENV